MTTELKTEHSKPGFAILLQAIEQKIVAGMTLRAALEIILTLDGRQCWSFGIQSLTASQLALLKTTSTLRLQPVSAKPGEHTWFLGLWSYGRVWLAPHAPDDPECRHLATLDLTLAQHVETASRTRTISASRAHYGQQLSTFFAQLDAEQLKRVLYEVHEAVDHTDPMLLYIEDELFSNFGKFNNLQERAGDLPHCFHRRAETMSINSWTWAEKCYVFCMYWLRMAGCRGEEFNGRQLTPVMLDKYFDQRLDEYKVSRQTHSEDGLSIADKARLLAQCKAERAADLLTYRWVNGLNFYKEERLCERARVKAGVETLPPALRDHLRHACGVDASQHASLASLFEECVARMAAFGFASDQPGMNAIEKLLQVIVECAIEATGSDVGMTRGTRDVAGMQKAFAEERYEEICAWPSANYYCAVFPSAAMCEKFSGRADMLVKILYACSGRMQFNHWHYMPGHCPRDKVPAGRHFYLPPRMPDIAVWSDQHHAGHVLAEVRYSIRSPAPLYFNGRTWPGLVDLRLFRQSGESYTEDELLVALTYTEYVRAVHQALSDRLARGDIAFCIQAFDKDWFRSFYAETPSVQAIQPGPSLFTAPMPSEAAWQPPANALYRLICRHAMHGKGAALIEARQPYADVSLDYGSLLGWTQAFGRSMQRHGIAPGERIVLLSQRPLYQAVAIIAGIANGLVVNPLNPGLSHAVLQAQVKHAQPRLLIVDGSVDAPADLPPGLPCVTWDSLFPGSLEAVMPSALPPEIDPQAQAEETGGLLIYTSGTTGNSKGVLLNWRLIAANVHAAIERLGFEPGWTGGSMLPRFHTFTLISDLFPALFLGGTTVLADTFDLRNVKWTVDAFHRHGVQSYSAAPIILEALCGLRAWTSAPAMRFAVAGAAPLKENTRLEYLKTFGHPIIPCYGLSETTCFATISPSNAIRPGSAGLPAGIEIRVIDEQGVSLGRDVTGELAMRGSSVIREGYFHDEQGQFAAAFTADGWFRTGDIGRIDEDGYVYVTGRKKNMVIRGGEKIYLEDVDRCLADCLGVVDSASMVLCRPQMPDQALCFIVTAGEPLPVDDINAHIRAALTAQHVPDRIYFVERIPRTPSGKASHPELLALAGRADQPSKEPA